MPAEAIIPQIMEDDLSKLVINGSPDDALIKGAAEHIRKQGHDVDAHGASPTGSATLKSASRVLFVPYLATFRGNPDGRLPTKCLAHDQPVS